MMVIKTDETILNTDCINIV